MTESRRDTSHVRDNLQAAMEKFLRSHGQLPPGRILTHAIVVYRTRQANPEGKDTSHRGRAYPLGTTDPTMERGMLDDALYDARKHRT